MFLRENIDDLLHRLPNLPDETVPLGKDDTDNVEIRKWGRIKKYAFPLKIHNDLLESLDLADIERAAKVAGSRFYYSEGMK